MTHRTRRVVVWLLAALLVLLSGCREQPIVGELDDSASVALVRFEALEDGVSGVVYRRVNRFEAFIGASDRPILVAFYQRSDDLNTLIIPGLEQMADDYRDRLHIVWIDAAREPAIAQSFGVTQLPQFTMVEGASLKRSLIGYDGQGPERLDELIQPYITQGG
ncbi:MAG: hypothetical protein GX112_12210 [Clostridiaceae bacterium]|jgi:thioredoxin 1|nr:hypothetical protein [Clostridiaceae bacterium]